MWQIGDLNKVILYSSILFLIFGFGITSFNESFAEVQEFDEEISITLESNTSTENKQNKDKSDNESKTTLETEQETEQEPE